ncbi:unnamed protein product [Lactuca virosa]|uniref:TRUD domain-containing protein n=1 Tax=Lactuca virosa TaxID=75947 RepID=A0AAU9NAH6_9ASTR|nr:unnamed protein product [Lactuca virosa]
MDSSLSHHRNSHHHNLMSLTTIPLLQVALKKVYISQLLSPYSDFIVNEVDLDGNVVHLTSLDAPMETAEEHESKSTNQPNVHNFFKEKLKFLVTDTVDGPESSSKCIHVRLNSRGNNERGRGDKKRKGRDETPYDSRGSDWPEHFGKFLRFHLCKENKDTQEALGVIGKMLGIQPRAFGFSGTKDKRAVTTQRHAYRPLPPKMQVFYIFSLSMKSDILAYLKSQVDQYLCLVDDCKLTIKDGSDQIQIKFGSKEDNKAAQKSLSLGNCRRGKLTEITSIKEELLHKFVSDDDVCPTEYGLADIFQNKGRFKDDVAPLFSLDDDTTKADSETAFDMDLWSVDQLLDSVMESAQVGRMSSSWSTPWKSIHNHTEGVVADSEDTVKAATDALGKHGFVNYFGMQSFGSGAKLLKGKWKEGVSMILDPRDGDILLVSHIII